MKLIRKIVLGSEESAEFWHKSLLSKRYMLDQIHYNSYLFIDGGFAAGKCIHTNGSPINI